jgi:interleukin-1 receptor-associated kinase 1
VYGFGALLLEIISGHRCFSLASGESGDDHGFLNRRVSTTFKLSPSLDIIDIQYGPFS